MYARVQAAVINFQKKKTKFTSHARWTDVDEKRWHIFFFFIQRNFIPTFGVRSTWGVSTSNFNKVGQKYNSFQNLMGFNVKTVYEGILNKYNIVRVIASTRVFIVHIKKFKTNITTIVFFDKIIFSFYCVLSFLIMLLDNFQNK